MKKQFAKWVYPAIFVGIVLIFFYQVFLGKLPVPTDTLVGLYHPWRDTYASQYPRGVPFRNFLITDPVRQQIPWRKTVIDQWKQGTIPWWNPYSFSGTVLAGNIQAAAFYPFNILFFFLSFPSAWTVLIMLQPIGAGLFLYAYLRSRGLHPVSCLFGALAWSFSGFSVAWLTWGTMMQTAMWTPLVLLSVDKIIDGSRRWWILLAVAWVMQFFAGHAQIALYCLLLALAYACMRVFEVKKNRRRIIADLANAGGVFVFVTLIQWLPFAWVFLSSSRAILDSWTQESFFLPHKHLVQFIAPDFFGNPATMNYWGSWNWAEFVGFIGIVPFVLAMYMVITERKRVVFWIWAVIISLLFALPTPLAVLPYKLHIPVWSSLQPTRLMVIVDLALAVLAAYGLDAYMRKPRKVILPLGVIALVFSGAWAIVFTQPDSVHFMVAKRNLILPSAVFIASFISLLAAQYLSRMRHIALGILIFLSVFDLLRFSWKFTPFTPREYFFPETAIISFLKNQPKPFRVMSLDERILPANVSGYYGIESIEGYDPVYNSRYEKLFASMARPSGDISGPYGFNRILTAKNIDSPILPYFNVKYVLSLEDVERPFLAKVMQEGETRLYEYKKALPRIEFVQRYTVIPPQEESRIVRVMAETMKVQSAVVGKPLEILSFPMTTSDRIRIEAYTPNVIRLHTTASNPRIMVVRNAFDPGWRAEVDGVRKNIIPVDFIFWGIVVPAGKHEVLLRYQ